MSSQSTITSESLDNLFHHFEITYQSPHETTWKQRRIILLGENHTDRFFRMKYSSLIDAMSKTHSIVVLVEGEKSMNVINKNESAQTCFITSDVMIYGWDDSTPKDRYPDLPQIQKCVDLFLKYELKILELEAETDIHVLKELKQEATEIFNDFIATQNQLDQEEYMKAVRENFPDRTESMVSTIKKVVELHPESQIIVIAGLMHVKQEFYDDPRMDLSPLYKYLDAIESVTLVKNPNADCVIF